MASLATIRSQVLSRLEEITASPKPDYWIGDEKYNYGQYYKILTEQLKALDEAVMREEGPIELVMRGVT